MYFVKIMITFVIFKLYFVNLAIAFDLESTVDLGPEIYSINCLPNWGIDLDYAVDLEDRVRESFRSLELKKGL